MSASERLVPPDDVWTVAIHTSATDFTPVGAGVVIDSYRVLTCAHVVAPGGQRRPAMWVSFPKEPGSYSVRCVVRDVHLPPDVARQDVAVLELESEVPAAVAPAPVSRPRPTDLFGNGWWAFGFPESDPFGNGASGTVGEALSFGWVRLLAAPKYLVERGFSGAGLWSQQYQAVVGLVGQAKDDGDGRALTFFQADLFLPEQKLAALVDRRVVEAAGEQAQAAWGWALTRDKEGVRHWRSRARGVSSDSEGGYRFRGRTAALNAVVGWLDRPVPDARVLVVTGSPGVGKSAVLGRIVTTADPEIRAALPANDAAVRASVESVRAAVHAKGKTALEVAVEIARAASAPLPETVEDLALALRGVLAERPPEQRRFNVVVDALDEASSPVQARIIVSRLLLPLVQVCGESGVQVVVGTRRRDDGGDLLGVFGTAIEVIDLDTEHYFELEDLTAYALASLQLLGAERPGNPYADSTVAEPVAASIAGLADRNFLIAGLVARTHGMYDDQPVAPASLTFTATVSATLRAYLDRLGSAGSAQQALTALAYAQAPGLSIDLWRTACSALGGRLSEEDLAAFARSGAANFLVETGQDRQVPTYQLFHQALNDALLQDRDDRAHDERALAEAFLAHGQRAGWEHAPAYLLRFLPDHAVRGGVIDEVLADSGYLLHADLQRLIPAADQATTSLGRARARLLRLSSGAITAAPAERAAMFQVVAATEGLDTSTLPASAGFRIRWAKTRPRNEHTIFTGHTDAVWAVCVVRVGGCELLASASYDRTVRIWDPATGAEHTRFTGHTDWVNTVCTVRVNGQELLASAGYDRTVRVWDPATGAEHTRFTGHTSSVRAVCAVHVDGRELLASASRDDTVRVWDPATGAEHTRFTGHTDSVRAVCVVRVGGRELLASASQDHTVRVWDPATGVEHTRFTGHTHSVRAVCAIQVGPRQLLASAGQNDMVRIWDPNTGTEQVSMTGHSSWVNAVCAVRVDGRELLASASQDRTVRIWDPVTGAEYTRFDGHAHAVRAVGAVRVGGRELLAAASSDGVRIWNPATGSGQRSQTDQAGSVRAVCAVRVDGRQLLAAASQDHTVRIWDPATGTEQISLTGTVRAVCAVRVGDRELLAFGESGGVRIWDPATGAEQSGLTGHSSWVNAVCTVRVGERQLLASGSLDGVRVWDPATGVEQTRFTAHTDWVNAVCAVRVGGRELLASASQDQTVRIWDPVTGAEQISLTGHTSWLNAICAVRAGERELLASASQDQTVRIWDPVTGAEQASLTGHSSWINAVCAVRVRGHDLLASASHDRTVRVWDPATGACRSTIPVFDEALACTEVDGALVVGLVSGLLVIDLYPRA